MVDVAYAMKWSVLWDSIHLGRTKNSSPSFSRRWSFYHIFRASVWWVIAFDVRKVALSALLCKCSKNVNFSWKTNKRCYEHDKCLAALQDQLFLQVFMALLHSKQICRCIQKMYFCLGLKYSMLFLYYSSYFCDLSCQKKTRALHAKLLLHTVTKSPPFARKVCWHSS